MIFRFDYTDRGIRSMAVLVSQFVREGITFSVMQDDIGFEVKLTGGF